MSREEIWSNQDGLAVGFGTRTQARTLAVRHPGPDGAIEKVVLRVRGEDLADAVAVSEDQLIHGVVIPNGATIMAVTTKVTEAFVGATAVLDVGSYNIDSGAAIDDDGFVAAAAVASLTLGAEVAGAGALVDTTLGTAVKVAASFDTAAFTAGEALIEVEYSIPPA